MTTITPPGWYPDTVKPGTLRYWDGTTWTEHEAPGIAPTTLIAAPIQPKIKPGLAAVWITAVLSIFTFYFRIDVDRDVTTVSIPFGVIFAIICWTLVRRAKREAQRRGQDLPGAYRGAAITAGVLAAISVVSSAFAMFG